MSGPGPERVFSVNDSGGFLGSLGGRDRASACNCGECSTPDSDTDADAGDSPPKPSKGAAPARAANDGDGDDDGVSTHAKLLEIENEIFGDPRPILSKEAFESLSLKDQNTLVAYRLRRLSAESAVPLPIDENGRINPDGEDTVTATNALAGAGNDAPAGDPSNYGRAMFMDGGTPPKRSRSSRMGSSALGVNYAGYPPASGDSPPKRPPRFPNSKGTAPPKDAPADSDSPAGARSGSGSDSRGN